MVVRQWLERDGKTNKNNLEKKSRMNENMFMYF